MIVPKSNHIRGPFHCILSEKMGSRSDLSSNWRIKSDTASSSTQDIESDPRSALTEDRGNQKEAVETPSTDDIRGEDDPRTLQAIDEGRRLYVGNLLYAAKPNDVESLFLGNKYEM